ncbi:MULTISPECIES: toll/interleukin-1 receptor domain-containing protein [Fusobacterium]|uniref:toll/interleukin-1 receptor domain-containing protein n=1 Tax=Fusobacterium TaxID=848 RepID=UPI001C37D263|nr:MULTISPECIES: toll/interleukin-1 receptor domain-containing protein [Fusobacterium]
MGVTKRIYEHEIRDIKSMWISELKKVQEILPKVYNENDIIKLLKEFYPYEWKSVDFKYNYYKIKDKYLLNAGKKSRYKMLEPDRLIKTLPLFKKMLTKEYKEKYSKTFDEEKLRYKREEMLKNRQSKIKRVDEKIEKALSKTQRVTPIYLDKLIGLYERKRTTQKDKVYILLELKKYYSEKIINFFLKVNDTEINYQLRWEAFYHLQSFNFNPRARRQKYMQVHTKNKKRKKYLKEVYAKEKFNIPLNPDELEYRIKNGREQQLKEFDFFISHSSKDGKAVQKLITYQNENGKNIFCDWINDSDYLKRNLLCKATLNVIELRLQQSKNLIFVESENSKNSVWCKYELNYYSELDRPIYYITKEDIENNNFNIRLLEDKWFIDKNYKEEINFKQGE